MRCKKVAAGDNILQSAKTLLQLNPQLMQFVGVRRVSKSRSFVYGLAHQRTAYVAEFVSATDLRSTARLLSSVVTAVSPLFFGGLLHGARCIPLEVGRRRKSGLDVCYS